jgi:hypothetical protein
MVTVLAGEDSQEAQLMP